MLHNKPSKNQFDGPLPAELTHPLDLVGVPQTNSPIVYDEEHSWRDMILTHWDIRRFDVCTMQGEKIYSIDTPLDMDEFPYTTLSRRTGVIATYDWKDFGRPARVLCALWRKRKKKEHEWMEASRYVKGRSRNHWRRSSSDAVYHTFTTTHDARKYAWRSAKDCCVLYHVNTLLDVPVVACVSDPELITTGPFKGTKKRILRFNETHALGLDLIMSTFLIVDDKRARKYMPNVSNVRHPLAHLHLEEETLAPLQKALDPERIDVKAFLSPETGTSEPSQSRTPDTAQKSNSSSRGASRTAEKNP